MVTLSGIHLKQKKFGFFIQQFVLYGVSLSFTRITVYLVRLLFVLHLP